MHPATSADVDATIRVENIGGIDSAAVEFASVADSLVRYRD